MDIPLNSLCFLEGLEIIWGQSHQLYILYKELPISQRLGIISCLPKGDKPRQYLKNWRPITLLNVLYKIISGCLSQRIKDTLDHIISETQSGFLKGRYIGENTCFIYDILFLLSCIIFQVYWCSLHLILCHGLLFIRF